jgi:hypothetical protein
MTYLIYGYIFASMCFAAAFWGSFSADPRRKKEVASIGQASVFTKVVVALFIALISLAWPAPVLIKLFRLALP